MLNIAPCRSSSQKRAAGDDGTVMLGIKRGKSERWERRNSYGLSEKGKTSGAST
jgi:hypothetical protein